MSLKIKPEGEQFSWKMFMTHTVKDEAGVRRRFKGLMSTGLGVADKNGCRRMPKEVQALMPCESKIADFDAMTQGDDEVDIVWTVHLKEDVDPFNEKGKVQVGKLTLFRKDRNPKADKIDWTEIDADINHDEKAQPRRLTIQ